MSLSIFVNLLREMQSRAHPLYAECIAVWGSDGGGQGGAGCPSVTGDREYMLRVNVRLPDIDVVERSRESTHVKRTNTSTVIFDDGLHLNRPPCPQPPSSSPAGRGSASPRPHHPFPAPPPCPAMPSQTFPQTPPSWCRPRRPSSPSAATPHPMSSSPPTPPCSAQCAPSPAPSPLSTPHPSSSVKGAPPRVHSSSTSMGSRTMRMIPRRPRTPYRMTEVCLNCAYFLLLLCPPSERS